ncbi:MAG: SH3 domain-containing protein [Tateyamaria sp.]|uniref:SH3 domain-containing protein n=1 Tax=Tateyamaria sp. TaxID=1929288 RepID=UPI00329FC2F9
MLKRLFTTLALAWTSITPAAALDIGWPTSILPELDGAEWIYPDRIADGAIADWHKLRADFFEGIGTLETPPRVLRLSGVIGRGDADRVIEALGDPTGPNWMKILVLDSPGGNFLEALRIGQYLQYVYNSHDPNIIGAFVLEEDQCLSACALILAMGQGKIAAGAKVGFHMGLLPADTAQSVGVIKDSMDLTYDIVLEYMQLIDKGHQSPLLLREALKHRDPTSFFYLYGGIRSWGLGFQPFGKGAIARDVGLAGLDSETALRLCQAMYAVNKTSLTQDTLREHAVVWDDMFLAGVYNDEAAPPLMRDLFSELGPDVSFTSNSLDCLLRKGQNDGLEIGFFEGTFGIVDPTIPECVQTIDEGHCASTGAATSPVKIGLLAAALGCPNGTLTVNVPRDEANNYPGRIEPVATRKGIVKRSVNLRNTPDTRNAPLKRLEAGAAVTIVDCALADDDQGVWFSVTADGTEGWVSARFIQELFDAYPLAVTH